MTDEQQPKTLEERFNALVKVIQSLPKDGPIQVPDDKKLNFYKYFKQATEGNVKTPQPYFFNVIERAKWDAWNSVKDMSKEEAMQAYVNEMKDLLDSAPYEHEMTQKLFKICDK